MSLRTLADDVVNAAATHDHDATHEAIEKLRAHLAPCPNIFVCQTCGTSAVETSAWIDPNTDENTGSEGPSSYDFCPVCEDRHDSCEVRITLVDRKTGKAPKGWDDVEEDAERINLGLPVGFTYDDWDALDEDDKGSTPVVTAGGKVIHP